MSDWKCTVCQSGNCTCEYWESDDPISVFSLTELPQEMKEIDRRNLKIPPVLQRQLDTISFQVGRINVAGNGNCGYYVIQLLEYLVNNHVRSLENLQMVRIEAILAAKIDAELKLRLVGATNHYLEYLEVGMILDRILPSLNIAVVVQTDVKKSGDKRQRREYPVRVLNYKIGQCWAFLLMSCGAHHYELLTEREKDRHRALFISREAREIFAACSAEYPTEVVDAKNQLGFLDPEDFRYF